METTNNTSLQVAWVIKKYFECGYNTRLETKQILRQFYSAIPHSVWEEGSATLVSHMESILKRIPHEESFCHKITEDFVLLLCGDSITPYPFMIATACKLILLYHKYNGDEGRKSQLIDLVFKKIEECKQNKMRSLSVAQVKAMMFTKQLQLISSEQRANTVEEKPRISKDRKGKLVYVLPPSSKIRENKEKEVSRFVERVCHTIEQSEEWLDELKPNDEEKITDKLVDQLTHAGDPDLRIL